MIILLSAGKQFGNILCIRNFKIFVLFVTVSTLLENYIESIRDTFTDVGTGILITSLSIKKFESNLSVQYQKI